MKLTRQGVRDLNDPKPPKRREMPPPEAFDLTLSCKHKNAYEIMYGIFLKCDTCGLTMENKPRR